LSLHAEPVAKATKRPSQAARNAQTTTITVPEKKQVKTCLVASCGWPTDAALPARRSIAKR
jgi:hypothetical protein